MASYNKREQGSENIQRDPHEDREKNKQMSDWLVQFWSPKIGERVRLSSRSEVLDISWNKGPSGFADSITFDQPSKEFKQRVNSVFRHLKILAERPKLEVIERKRTLCSIKTHEVRFEPVNDDLEAFFMTKP
jgi:hypothetical protein